MVRVSADEHPLLQAVVWLTEQGAQPHSQTTIPKHSTKLQVGVIAYTILPYLQSWVLDMRMSGWDKFLNGYICTYNKHFHTIYYAIWYTMLVSEWQLKTFIFRRLPKTHCTASLPTTVLHHIPELLGWPACTDGQDTAMCSSPTHRSIHTVAMSEYNCIT